MGKALGKFLAAGLLLAFAVSTQASSAGEQMTVHQILDTTTTATGQAIALPSNPRVIGSIVVLPPVIDQIPSTAHTNPINE